MTSKVIQSANYTAIDLFCGAGGLSTALERSGFSSVAAVDHDRDCIATLRRNQAKKISIVGTARKYLEETKLLQGDIREITRADLVPADAPENWRPDVLAGGPPCQPFSAAGSGLGLNDPRGQLFQHFVRLAEELRPRFILFENVAGLVTAKGKDGLPGGALKLIQSHFESAGYACRFELMNAADFGAPQRRVRLYMIASCDENLPTFPDPTHSDGRLSDTRAWQTLGEFLAHLPDPLEEDIVRPTGKRADELVKLRPGTGLKSGGIVEANRPSGHWGYRQDCFVADPMLPSRTIRAASTPDWLQTEAGLRRLTWRECAALQGFPTPWEFEGARASRFRQIGNAVQGEIGEAVAKTIVDALGCPVTVKPVSAPWPSNFIKRVRYTAMEARVNGAHRQAAKAEKALMAGASSHAAS